eukprot:522240_1
MQNYTFSRSSVVPMRVLSTRPISTHCHRPALVHGRKRLFYASLSIHSRYFFNSSISTETISQTQNDIQMNVIPAVNYTQTIESNETSPGMNTNTATEDTFWSKWSAYFKQTLTPSTVWFVVWLLVQMCLFSFSLRRDPNQ